MPGITHANILSLKENEIFVFGSNEAGIHGKGAAKVALLWGAQYYKGVGLYGQTYALPTRDKTIKTLPIEKIKMYVDELLLVIRCTPTKHFIVTEIGCGLAGFSVNAIGPLFKDYMSLDNVSLPQKFIDILVKPVKPVKPVKQK